MNKLLASSLIGSFLFFGSSSVKAEWDYWIGNNKTIWIIDSDTKEKRKVINWNDPSSQFYSHVISGLEYSNSVETITFEANGNKFWEYNKSTNSYKEITPWYNNVETSTGNYENFSSDFRVGKHLVNQNSDGSITFGDNGSTSINNKGISVSGNNLIKKESNGELHIGENSWITKEENGRQKVYAKDATGNPIPIDYTNGTKLLINGRDIEQSINNIGALSAALTGLPTVPTDTTIACGLGTGTHGGDIAFSGGCASKVNEKLSINYAASMTMPGQDYAGNFEDTFSARAGFVWKLGKATKPAQISMKDKKVMETKIELLEKKNKTILSKNQKLENKLSILMTRLEKIEKIALGESKSEDLAVHKLQ